MLKPADPGPRLARPAAGDICPDSPVARGGGSWVGKARGLVRHSPGGKPREHDSAYQSHAERSIRRLARAVRVRVMDRFTAPHPDTGVPTASFMPLPPGRVDLVRDKGISHGEPQADASAQ